MEMKQEWIIQYNRLCAEFLEWEYFQPYWYPKEDSHGIYKTPWNIEIMKFHSDWNWIIEVVEAIQNTTNPKTQEDTTHLTLRLNIRDALGRVDRNKTIQSINQFIDWYNKQKEL